MSEYALPCVICGKELRNEFPGHVQNQPRDGVAFTSPGNYGSTVWDSFSGEFLEVNICDPCLVAAGEAGRVYAGRNRRPVQVEGFHVGWEDIDRPLVPWHEDLPGYGDSTILEVDELDVELPGTVHLTWTVEEIRKMTAELRDAEGAP